MDMQNTEILTSAEVSPEKMRSPFGAFLQKMRKEKLAVGAGLFLLVMFLSAFLAPFFFPYTPDEFDYYNTLSEPSLKHWAGTDEFGRDILARLMFGAKLSLYIGFVSVTLGAVFGVTFGLLAGYYGGWIDSLTMRISDVLFAFPGMLLAIGIIAVLGPGLNNVIIAVAVFSIPAFARIVRGGTLALKESTYVEAARAVGARDRAIMFRHILPGVTGAVIVYFTMRIGTSILTAAGLSFIGLGIEPSIPEWGAMLSSGREYLLAGEWHLTFFPGFAIFLTVLCFNLLGDGLRDALDPKLGDQE